MSLKWFRVISRNSCSSLSMYPASSSMPVKISISGHSSDFRKRAFEKVKDGQAFCFRLPAENMLSFIVMNTNNTLLFRLQDKLFPNPLLCVT